MESSYTKRAAIGLFVLHILTLHAEVGILCHGSYRNPINICQPYAEITHWATLQFWDQIVELFGNHHNQSKKNRSTVKTGEIGLGHIGILTYSE